MKIQIEINADKLLGKAKDLDLVKLMELWNEFKDGKSVQLFGGDITIKKAEEKKKK